MPKLSKDQQQVRRRRILEAAERCFARAGFHRTTMQDICREAGISAGALYIYFPSKEALIAGIAENEQAKVLDQFGALGASMDFLSGMARVLESCVVEHPSSKAVLFLEIVAESSRNPEVRAILRRVDAAIQSSLRDLFEKAKRDGRISPATPVDRLTEAMSVVVDGLMMRRVIDAAFDPRGVAPLLMQTISGLAVGGAGEGVPANSAGRKVVAVP